MSKLTSQKSSRTPFALPNFKTNVITHNRAHALMGEFKTKTLHNGKLTLFFSYKLLKIRPCAYMRIFAYKRMRSVVRNYVNIYKFSFLTLSIRLLNLFLYKFVSYKYADFKNHFQDYNNLYSSFSSYVKSRESWSIG